MIGIIFITRYQTSFFYVTNASVENLGTGYWVGGQLMKEVEKNRLGFSMKELLGLYYQALSWFID